MIYTDTNDEAARNYVQQHKIFAFNFIEYSY